MLSEIQKEDIRRQAIELGAEACGFAEAKRVSDQAIALYDRWISTGSHASMHYCERYREQRTDPRLLLDGAQTVISCAFNYYTGESDLPMAPHIAKYAWGDDYHWVIKSRLNRLGEYIAERYGGEFRVCVDTAPIRERYWAVQAGIGFIGINNQLIVPGVGSYVFLGELLWTGSVAPDSPCTMTCDGCQACVKACPGRALDGSGVCDARRCISYLTIEHRGDLPEDAPKSQYFYGCDLCQKACKHNRQASITKIDEFSPNVEIMMLDAEAMQAMTSSHFRRLTAHSAMSRVTLAQMIRNIRHTRED